MIKKFNITGNVADAEIEWFWASDDLGINFSFYWEDGGVGTLTIKRRFSNYTKPLKFSDGDDVAFTSDFDEPVFFKRGERFGIGVSGADSNCHIVGTIAGQFTIRRK